MIKKVRPDEVRPWWVEISIVELWSPVLTSCSHCYCVQRRPIRLPGVDSATSFGFCNYLPNRSLQLNLHYIWCLEFSCWSSSLILFIDSGQCIIWRLPQIYSHNRTIDQPYQSLKDNESANTQITSAPHHNLQITLDFDVHCTKDLERRFNKLSCFELFGRTTLALDGVFPGTDFDLDSSQAWLTSTVFNIRSYWLA